MLRHLKTRRLIVENVSVHYGLTVHIHSELLVLLIIHKSIPSPYHPQEHSQHLLVNGWHPQLCTRNDATGFLPYFLVFG